MCGDGTYNSVLSASIFWLKLKFVKLIEGIIFITSNKNKGIERNLYLNYKMGGGSGKP